MTDNHNESLEKQRNEKLDEIYRQEKEVKEHASGTFAIDIVEIEELMGAYKDRGSIYKDLDKIHELGGPEGIMSKLKTDPVRGIDSIDNRVNDFGSNVVFSEPVPPFCSYVWEALEDLMVRILIVAAIVQIFLGALFGEDPSKDWVDGMSIIAAVLVVTLVGSITNYQKETKFHELNTIQNEGTIYSITREGIMKDMKSDEILVGDLMHVSVGDILPADLILIEGNGIKIDESSLTGESDLVNKDVYEKCQNLLIDKNLGNKNNSAGKIKNIPSPLMLSGTSCVEGTGNAIVLAVGDHSQKGIIKRTVDNAQENNQTPLEIKLDSIAKYIGWFGMAAGIITLVALTIRFAIHFSKNWKEYEKESAKKDLLTHYLSNYPSDSEIDEIKNSANINLTNPKSEISANILNIIMLCVSIIVVAIPEGLPLAVTLSLAFSIKKLMEQNNLVRKMHACETMGGANYICTDKTGTLTKNEMHVYKFLSAKEEIEMKQESDEEEAGNLLNKSKKKSEEIRNRENHTLYFKNENYWDQVKLSIALNVDAKFNENDNNNNEQNGEKENYVTKNKTDKAFIDFLYRFQDNIEHDRKKYMDKNINFKVIPFDSKKKRMTTLIKNDEFPSGYRLYTKGGAEKVKTICKHYLDPGNGKELPIGDQERNFINDKIQQFNRQMLRCLYLCYKDISQEEFDSCEDYTSSDGKKIDEFGCVFLACVGIRDCLREGVQKAVKDCNVAGVNVVMVTGDNIVTATAIAKDCNILNNNLNLENLTPEDIEEEPELIDNPQRREQHIQEILEIKPRALTGNTFFAAIGGILCKTCGEDSSLCKCPKTQAEAEEMAKKLGKEKLPIKNDTICEKERFIELTKNLKVLARSQPLHKYALVLGLKELGKIVAVTGDGTNDAPALSKSDVGFSMNAGTDIAKESSDIVILDNNFSSLVVAIIFGRNIYDNIRKFLQFQLTVNFCACLLVFICACIGNETPLTTIQMLWINLIMDSLGSLALATEPPYPELLHRKPTRKDESIINGKMWKHIIIQSLIQLILLLFLYLYAPHFVKEDDIVRLTENYIIFNCYGQLPGKTKPENVIFGTSPQWVNSVKLKNGMSISKCGVYGNKQDLSIAYTEYNSANASSSHMTIVFNVFVVYTLFNQINCRVIDDSYNIFVRIQNNFFFPLITISELLLQVILIEFGGDAFKCSERGLTGKQWGLCIGFSAVTFVLSIIIKWLPIHNFIQNMLDNSSKGNKVANMDDLIDEENEKCCKDNNGNSNKNLVNNYNNYINVERKSNNNNNPPMKKVSSSSLDSSEKKGKFSKQISNG